MKILCTPMTVLVLAIVWNFGVAAQADDEKTELEGDWIAESALQAGKKTDEPVGDKVQFAAAKMTIVPKGDKKGPPEMTFRIDTTQSPKHITIEHMRGDNKLTVMGVYEIKDDTLRLCLAPPNAARPTKLESQAETKQFSIVLKRAKPADKSK